MVDVEEWTISTQEQDIETSRVVPLDIAKQMVRRPRITTPAYPFEPGRTKSESKFLILQAIW